MTKYTEINGEYFEIIHSKKTIDFVKWHTTHERARTLEECYARPSDTKRAIFKKWNEWAADTWPVVYQFGITSYNSFLFTLGALYDGELGEGFIQITTAHNRLYLNR